MHTSLVIRGFTSRSKVETFAQNTDLPSVQLVWNLRVFEFVRPKYSKFGDPELLKFPVGTGRVEPEKTE